MEPSSPNQTRRLEMLKQMLQELHAGKSVEEVKAQYGQILHGVNALEVSTLEQALLDAGVPEEEIRGICDLHVDAFEPGIGQQSVSNASPEPSINTYLVENTAAGKILDQMEKAITNCDWHRARQLLQDLCKFENHYVRKEHILFPYLERHHFTGPTTVMWSIHDTIRGGWKELEAQLSDQPDPTRINAVFQPLAKAMRDMFFKEEQILFPTAQQLLSAEEWETIRTQGKEAGLAFLEREAPAISTRTATSQETIHALPETPDQKEGGISLLPLQTGRLTAQQVDLLLTHLPVDVTFVDENDEVRYFSDTSERIFTRTPSIIGRKVQKCHPASSVHRVQKIIDDFRAGKRDVAAFWIQMGPKGEKRFIYIRYFAVRDEQGQYRGTLEVSQDITEIRTLEGEHRLEADE